MRNTGIREQSFKVFRSSNAGSGFISKPVFGPVLPLARIHIWCWVFGGGDSPAKQLCGSQSAGSGAVVKTAPETAKILIHGIPPLNLVLVLLLFSFFFSFSFIQLHVWQQCEKSGLQVCSVRRNDFLGKVLVEVEVCAF